MSKYRKILLAAVAAIVTAYGGALALIVAQGGSALALTLGVVCYLVWVAAIIAVQAAVTPGNDPDEREALIDLRSEQLSARVSEAGVFGLLALVLVSAFTGPEPLGWLAPTRTDTLVAYLITIVTAAALARLIYALWLERRA